MKFTRMAAVAAAIAGVLGAGVGAGTATAAPSVVLGAGSGIVFDNNSACSLTAIGTDNGGRLVGITAGHCASTGARVGAEKALSAGVIGTVAYSDDAEFLDFAVLELDREKVAPTRTIGQTTVAGIGAKPGSGATVCADGRTTGRSCGVVWGELEGTSINQYCSQPGDSGGPVVVGDRLVGMNQGRFVGYGPVSFDVPCNGGANPVHSPAYFQPIGVILAALDKRGGVGAGFTVF
ncbi:S1 family peptidase [Nocardia thailandica]|uniref:S1 family peptidase n=1 Tax=Nocardia thailandica TaxID=257275 RepID=A0ABW6PIB6_9NOCA|nr:S1 family peptidase [Nocardia thailandica]